MYALYIHVLFIVGVIRAKKKKKTARPNQTCRSVTQVTIDMSLLLPLHSCRVQFFELIKINNNNNNNVGKDFLKVKPKWNEKNKKKSKEKEPTKTDSIEQNSNGPAY